MSTRELNKPMTIPTVFDDFFKPAWNEFFDMPTRIWNRMLTTPAVNIREFENEYKIELAAPGLTKEDFIIDVEGNMLTISAEKELKTEEKLEKYNKQEYNFTSFSRSFTLPEYVKYDAIVAKYENGVLKIVLPKKEEFKKAAAMKHIAVQ